MKVVYDDNEVIIKSGSGVYSTMSLTWEQTQELFDELQRNLAAEWDAHKEARKEILTGERDELLEQLAKIDAKLQNL
jgi:hypothetical protein